MRTAERDAARMQFRACIFTDASRPLTIQILSPVSTFKMESLEGDGDRDTRRIKGAEVKMKQLEKANSFSSKLTGVEMTFRNECGLH